MIEAGSREQLAALLPRVIDLAREAGRAILDVYAEPATEVELKQDGSPLTRADLASHHVIVDGLAHLTPQLPVLSEESAEISYEERKAWRHFWLVDPLDGTKEFIKRTGEFTVNIALMEANAPILGVVYAPVIGKMYSAARGLGAFRNEDAGAIRIYATPASDTVRMVISRSHRSKQDSLAHFAPTAANCEFVTMGSSLKFCLIAEGAADLYPRTGPTMEWDTAAAQCILEHAGGSVTNLDGDVMVYNKPDLHNSGFVARGAAAIVAEITTACESGVTLDSLN